MSFLPVVERELRVAARKKFTFWLRSGTALLAVLISGPVFLMATIAAMGASSSAGLYMFKMLAHYTYILCLLGGLFLASDCLSEERREGTLGFLFLTDLRGYDVVLGKFAGISLNAFYALLALFPILALPLLTGGVTGGEFWRMILALVNALFFSIAASVWISSRTESSFRAMSGTFAFLLLMGVVVPIFEGVRAAAYIGPALAYFSKLGPYEAMRFSSDAATVYGVKNYWRSLCLCHLAGWIFLGWASWTLPRSLESKSIGRRKGFWQKLWSGDLLAGTRKRKIELMERNPILWLLADSARMRSLAWGISAVGCAALVLLMVSGTANPMAAVFTTFSFFILLKILFAIQACRFFSESRRTGSMELFCCTPLTADQIIRGQWLALRRIFFLPVVILFSVLIVWMLVSILVSAKGDLNGMLVGSGFSCVHLAGSMADFFALGWFGMWLSLAGKKPGMAAGWSILFILILPWITYCFPQILLDIILILVTKAKLKQDFRTYVSGERRQFTMGSV